MPTCVLIRHGRTTANSAGVLAGWTDGVDLDKGGRRQVEALGSALANLNPVLVVSSPLLRCAHTAQILCELAWPHQDIAVDERVGECRYGSWTGGSLRELATEPLWRTVQDCPSAAHFPDGNGFVGESIAHMSARVIAAVREHDARVGAEHGPEAAWVLVSHGDPIKAVLADASGAHLDTFQRFVIAPASVSIVRYTPRRPFVVATNMSGAGLPDVIGRQLRPVESSSAGEAVVGGD